MLVGELQRVAILGGNRIPFARSGTQYLNISNQTLLTAALDGLVTRFNLAGMQLGEVVAGAVMKHSKDFNLTRESLLSTQLAPETPAYDLQQACCTGLEAAIAVANKIALGQIDVGIAGGVDTTSDAPIAISQGLRDILMQANAEKKMKNKLKKLLQVRPQHLIPDIPKNSEPRTGLSMGEHCQITAKSWGISRIDQEHLALASHHNLSTSYEEGFQDDLITPFMGLERDNNLRASSTIEQLAKLKPIFGAQSTMTAATSTPLTDGASAILMASEAWAKQHNLPVLAYFKAAEVAAVDFANKAEGLLMAPTYAVPQLLRKCNLNFGAFDYIEIHEAFAAQVLASLAAWKDEQFCKERLGLEKALGEIDVNKLNVKGSSLAAGHPFAATGGRILATLAKLLHQKGSGLGLISVCAAGGQGIAAILER